MDDEITQFARRYEEEQASIATEISKVVKLLLQALIAPNCKWKYKTKRGIKWCKLKNLTIEKPNP